KCASDGRCVDGQGQGNHLATWPVISFPQASGAAFTEVEHIANTKDHFRQAFVDLGALARSLRQGKWKNGICHPIRKNHIYYAGISLGGVLGGTFVTLDPGIKRAVLNVPGCKTVDLFRDSKLFGIQVTSFLQREKITIGSADDERFMD